ncbi:MAG TPA: pentapeptide repeat-containing protein, partial [Chloroflexota bacterium]|nr:pentapeptide repeat-containing protein [Chloroflexota bacterium]
ATLAGAVQHDLVITEPGSPAVVIDNLEVAQFVYLLMANARIRDVVDTVTSKLVLLLGRFTDERKAVLDHLRGLARSAGLVPVLFDFEGPAARNTTETVRLLAHLARFVIADLTDGTSVPYELANFIPHVRVPVVPIIAAGKSAFSMFHDLYVHDWLLPLMEYRDLDDVAGRVFPNAVAAADVKLEQLRPGWSRPS